jgi:N-acetylglucosamine kinase-like BadF-type ATPase
MRKSGGRGYLLGDEGSAYQLGRDALLAYLRSPTEASDAMKVVVEKYMGSLEEARILHRIYQSTTPQALIAKLAKGIGADAKLGLPYASASIRQRMGELASIVESHVQQNLSHQPHLEIGLAGGLWQIAPVFREQLMNQLLQRLPNHSLHLSRIQRAPVMGAVVLAREAILGN